MNEKNRRRREVEEEVTRDTQTEMIETETQTLDDTDGT